MKAAYVDTSYLVSVVFGERSAAVSAKRLAGFDELLAANFLEAELGAALRREKRDGVPEVMRSIAWVIPDRPLSAEIGLVLSRGYLRGADLWHLATALFVAQDPATVTFLTLDERQGAVAAKLGFRT